jgi:hypothetical protein
MGSKTENEIKIVSIHPLNKKKLTATIVGDSPLLVHRLSSKLEKLIRDRAEGNAVPKKKVRDPHQEYCDSLYWLDKNLNEIKENNDPSKHKYWGFPASG